MTIEERLAALEGETFDQLDARLNRNAERHAVAMRAAQPDPVAMRRNSLESELRQPRRQLEVLLRLVGEVNRDLAEHRATPKPTHGVERDFWIRKEEELIETLYEIEQGLNSSGYFAKLARREGIELRPGLIATKNMIARLESELAEVAPRKGQR